MLNKLSNNRAIALASLTAICVMAGIARGEDGGTEASMIPAAYFTGDYRDHGGYAGSDPTSCKEMRETAWFLNELQRSDGAVVPAPEVQCRPDVLAEYSTADAD